MLSTDDDRSPPPPAPAAQAIASLDQVSETVANLKQVEVMTALRRRKRIGPKDPLPRSWANRIGVTPDGTPMIAIQHPVLDERPDPGTMFLSGDDLARLNSPAAMWGGGPTHKTLARERWVASTPRWHPLAEGIDLLFSKESPEAELERRKRTVEAEVEADTAAANKAYEQQQERERRESARRAVAPDWDKLTVQARRWEVMASSAERDGDHARAEEYRRLADLEKVAFPTMPEGWRPR